MSDAASNGQRCSAIAASGKRCGIRSGLRGTPAGPRCIWHDEGRAAEAREMRQHAQAARRKKKERGHPAPIDAPPAPESIEDAQVALSWISHQVLTGGISETAAREATSALRVFITSVEKGRLEREVRELRARIQELKDATHD
jgi:hypothetical protein